MLARTGLPRDWDTREKIDDPELPDGAEFWLTGGHGYLRVDTRKLEAKVSEYDYLDGPHHVLLEEDCSVPMWLAEHGIIPMDRYIRDLIARIPRETPRQPIPVSQSGVYVPATGCSWDD